MRPQIQFGTKVVFQMGPWHVGPLSFRVLSGLIPLELASGIAGYVQLYGLVSRITPISQWKLTLHSNLVSHDSVFNFFSHMSRPRAVSHRVRRCQTFAPKPEGHALQLICQGSHMFQAATMCDIDTSHVIGSTVSYDLDGRT